MNRIVGVFCPFIWTFIFHLLSVYDQYYASLAASSAAVSALPTPTAQSVLGSSDSGDFGYDEEEDRKPSVQYLDSLNAYRKRSRSHEDVGSTAKIKQIKIDATEGVYGIGNGVGVVINGYTSENGIEVEQDAVMVGDAALLPEDDPMVYGRPLPVYLFHSQFIRFER